MVGASEVRLSDIPPVEPGDLLIAADGGYKNLQKFNIVPHVWVGDMDSLEALPADCETVRLPVVKDDTDMVYAARIGLERGFTEFVFCGVLGGERFSHSFAAVQTLHWLLRRGAHSTALAGGTTVTVIEGETMHFDPSRRGSVSVFSLTDRAVVTETGLLYTLDRAVLGNDFPLGVSNSFTGQEAAITAHEGVLAVIIEEKV